MFDGSGPRAACDLRMNPTVYWPDKTLTREIFCAPGLLAGLEAIVADGLLSIPRIGLGVGGLLVGRRVGERIEILKSAAISCSHAFGPQFVLTPEETTAAARLTTRNELAPAGETGAVLGVVGWYCSKTAAPKTGAQTVLSERDRDLFDALCPEPWQVALLMRTRPGEPTTAAFVFRGFSENGSGQNGHSQEAVARVPATVPAASFPASLSSSRPERHNVQPASELSEVAGSDVSGDGGLAAPGPRAEPELPAFSFATPAVSAAAPRSRAFFGARFGAPYPLLSGARARTDRAKSLALMFPSLFAMPDAVDEGRARLLRFAAGLLAVLIVIAFLIRGYWLPRPPIALMAFSDRTGRVSVLWNPEAIGSDAANRNDAATLVIADGAGPPHAIHLNRAGVSAGWFQYDCRPGVVTATLLAAGVSDSVRLTARAETTYLPERGISK